METIAVTAGATLHESQYPRAGTSKPHPLRESIALRLLMSSKTARAGAGSGEVPGWTLSQAAARLGWRRGSFMGCVLAGCRGEAWLKKGLLSSK